MSVPATRARHYHRHCLCLPQKSEERHDRRVNSQGHKEVQELCVVCSGESAGEGAEGIIARTGKLCLCGDM